MADRAHRHACAPSAPHVGTAMNAAPHTCGHPSDGTVGVQRALHLLTAPAVVAVHAFPLPLVAIAVDRPARDVEDRPPRILALTTQLRL